jgi:ATP-dependent DNA ligase
MRVVLRLTRAQRPGSAKADANRMLRHLLNKADDHVLRFSEPFPDPVKLLAAAETQGLEGIVSKLGHQPYRSGKNPGWIKVKCRAWRESNRDRWELF